MKCWKNDLRTSLGFKHLPVFFFSDSKILSIYIMTHMPPPQLKFPTSVFPHLRLSALQPTRLAFGQEENKNTATLLVCHREERKLILDSLVPITKSGFCSRPQSKDKTQFYFLVLKPYQMTIHIFINILNLSTNLRFFYSRQTCHNENYISENVKKIKNHGRCDSCINVSLPGISCRETLFYRFLEVSSGKET